MKISSDTLNILQLSIGFFLVFFAWQSQGFIETLVLNSYKGKGLTNNAGYIR